MAQLPEDTNTSSTVAEAAATKVETSVTG